MNTVSILENIWRVRYKNDRQVFYTIFAVLINVKQNMFYSLSNPKCQFIILAYILEKPIIQHIKQLLFHSIYVLAKTLFWLNAAWPSDWRTKNKTNLARAKLFLGKRKVFCVELRRSPTWQLLRVLRLRVLRQYAILLLVALNVPKVRDD